MAPRRATKYDGLSVGSDWDTTATMSVLDDAYAAIPGLVYDLDAARLTQPSTGRLGRERALGIKATPQGPGYSLVTSTYLNTKPALRLDGTAGNLITLQRGLTTPSFTAIMVGTLGTALRDSVSANSRGVISIYNSAGTLIVWIRSAPSTGHLAFSTTVAALGAFVVQSSLPATNVPAIFTFARNNATGAMTLQINGVTVGSATDATVPAVLASLPINVGINLATAGRGYSGDIARLSFYEGHIIQDYPLQYADLILAIKAQHGIA